jgi:hypothetical protein
MYNTKYRNEYKTKGRTGDIPANRNDYVPNSQTMDLRTTNEQFYTPFQVEKRPVYEEMPYSSDVKFTANSSYTSEFPNYGRVGKYTEKSPQQPYRGTMTKIDARTTYGSNFMGEKSTRRKSAIDLWASSSVINPPVQNEFTTSNNHYQNYGWNGKDVNHRVYREKEQYNPTMYSSVHFNSIQRDSY